MRYGAKPEVTCRPPAARLRRLGFQIRKPGARNLNPGEVKPSGPPKPNPGRPKPMAVRWPCPDPSPGARRQQN